jgi:hypothetical protein
MNFLIQLCKKAQTIITRKIRYVVYTKEEFEQQQNLLDAEKLLLIWKKHKLNTLSFRILVIILILSFLQLKVWDLGRKAV